MRVSRTARQPFFLFLNNCKEKVERDRIKFQFRGLPKKTRRGAWYVLIRLASKPICVWLRLKIELDFRFSLATAKTDDFEKRGIQTYKRFIVLL